MLYPLCFNVSADFLTAPNSTYHADFPNHLAHCKIIYIRRLPESNTNYCTQRRYILQKDVGKNEKNLKKKIASGEIEFELSVIEIDNFFMVYKVMTKHRCF